MKRIVILLLIATVTVARADDSKIAPELRGYPSNQQANIIVQYAPGTQLSCSGLLGLVGCLLSDILQLGGTILGDLPLINGVVAQLDGNGIVSLSNQSNVLYISPDRVLTPNLSNAAPAVNAFAAWQSGYTGTGIGVALVDSGVSSHPDLKGGLLGGSRVVWNQSFIPGNSGTNDQYGHGTHIAGLIAGDGASSRPRPRGLSGRVTTRETTKPAASSFSNVGTAKRGVPQKTRLRDGLNLHTYHSPALTSLRILRFIKSRFRALMWLI